MAGNVFVIFERYFARLRLNNFLNEKGNFGIYHDPEVYVLLSSEHDGYIMNKRSIVMCVGWGHVRVVSIESWMEWRNE